MPKKTILSLLIPLLMGLPAWAGLDLSLETGYLSGDTTYQIGGKYYSSNTSSSSSGVKHFPYSELAFPLDAWVARLGLENRFERLNIKTEIMTDIHHVSGEMQDSDWLTSSNPAQLDIYSESDSKLDLFEAGLKLNTPVLSRSGMEICLGLGYTYQEFDYDCGDTNQVNLTGHTENGLTIPSGFFPGRTISYKIEYQIPYAEVVLKSVSANCGVDLSLGFSPYVLIEDRDNHWLIPKTMYGELDGYAYLANLKCYYRLHPRVDLIFNLDYKNISAEGDQEQFGTNAQGAFYNKIEQEVTSEQLRSSLGLNVHF